MVKYAQKKGATKASERFGLSRQKVYKWLNRWRENPCVESLYDRSRRPHHSPKAHTEEVKLINPHKKKKPKPYQERNTDARRAQHT
jgi:transposase